MNVRNGELNHVYDCKSCSTRERAGCHGLCNRSVDRLAPLYGSKTNEPGRAPAALIRSKEVTFIYPWLRLKESLG